MKSSLLFRRTAEGQAALDRRDKRIPAKLRALMLMAEGKPVERFAELAAGLGFGPESFDELVTLGFAAAVDAGGAAQPAPDAVAANAIDPPAEPPETTSNPASGESGNSGEEDVYAHFREASGLMRELAGDNMGMKAFFFILKIEQCATLGDLGKLVPELVAAVARGRGRTEGERIAKHLYRIIG